MPYVIGPNGSWRYEAWTPENSAVVWNAKTYEAARRAIGLKPDLPNPRAVAGAPLFSKCRVSK